MKTTTIFSTSLVLLAAPLTLAQSSSSTSSGAAALESIMAQLPKCSISCLTTSTLQACGTLTDYVCSCGTQLQNITAATTPCLLQNCKKDEIATTTSLSTQLCQAALSGSAGASNATSSTTAGNGTTGASGSTSGSGSGSSSSQTSGNAGKGSGVTTNAGSMMTPGLVGANVALAIVGAAAMAMLM